MKRNRYEQLCDDVEHGIAHKVHHDITQREGTVVACQKDSLIVEIEKQTKKWSRQNCQPDD